MQNIIRVLSSLVCTSYALRMQSPEHALAMELLLMRPTAISPRSRMLGPRVTPPQVSSSKIKVEDIEVIGKRVFTRVDFSVPLDQNALRKATMTQRIDAAVPTIKAVLNRGAKSIVLASHLGHPDGTLQEQFSRALVAVARKEKLGKSVTLVTEAPHRGNVEVACADPPPGSVHNFVVGEGLDVKASGGLMCNLFSPGTDRRMHIAMMLFMLSLFVFLLSVVELSETAETEAAELEDASTPPSYSKSEEDEITTDTLDEEAAAAAAEATSECMALRMQLVAVANAWPCVCCLDAPARCVAENCGHLVTCKVCKERSMYEQLLVRAQTSGLPRALMVDEFMHLFMQGVELPCPICRTYGKLVDIENFDGEVYFP